MNLKRGDRIVLKKPDSIRDSALLICDSTRLLYKLDREARRAHQRVVLELDSSCDELQVFVENEGRRSDLSTLSELSTQRKGLLSRDAITFVAKNSSCVRANDWRVNFLDFSFEFIGRFSLNSAWLPLSSRDDECVSSAALPFMAYARFHVNKRSTNNGVYLFMENFHHGIVLVNGHSIGKFYANANANDSHALLLTIYVPGEMIYDGVNEMIVLDVSVATDMPPVCRHLVVYVSRYHILADRRILT